MRATYRDNKDIRQHRIVQDHAKQAVYTEMTKAPPVESWSARMPAYCYTVLCPMTRMRERPIS